MIALHREKDLRANLGRRVAFAAGLLIGLVQAAAAQTSLRVMVFPGVQNLPLFAADAKGFFTKRGLTVEVLPAPSSQEWREGLAAGRHQIAHGGVDNPVAMIEAAKVNAVVVMGGDNGLLHLYVQPEIRGYADLKGKTVIVDAPNTAFALVLYKMLAQNGLQRGDYQVKPVGSTFLRVEAMIKDKGNAATILNPPFTSRGDRAGLKNLDVAIQAIGPYLATAAAVMRPWAKDNADTLERYLAAYIEGVRWALNPANKAEATALFAERLKLAPDIAAETYAAATDPVRGFLARDAAIDLAGFQNVLKLRAEMEGTWGGNPPSPESYIDRSYYERALKGL